MPSSSGQSGLHPGSQSVPKAAPVSPLAILSASVGARRSPAPSAAAAPSALVDAASPPPGITASPPAGRTTLQVPAASTPSQAGHSSSVVVSIGGSITPQSHVSGLRSPLSVPSAPSQHGPPARSPPLRDNDAHSPVHATISDAAAVLCQGAAPADAAAAGSGAAEQLQRRNEVQSPAAQHARLQQTEPVARHICATAASEPSNPPPARQLDPDTEAGAVPNQQHQPADRPNVLRSRDGSSLSSQQAPDGNREAAASLPPPSASRAGLHERHSQDMIVEAAVSQPHEPAVTQHTALATPACTPSAQMMPLWHDAHPAHANEHEGEAHQGSDVSAGHAAGGMAQRAEGCQGEGVWVRWLQPPPTRVRATPTSGS